MKLSEIKGEKAIDTLALLIEPVAQIFADEEINKAYKAGLPKIKIVKLALQNHAKAVIEIMATLDGVEPDKYEFNLLTLPVKILEILNDEAFTDLFTSQSQENSFGSAMENIKEDAN